MEAIDRILRVAELVRFERSVKALHAKEIRYSVSGYEESSWESMEDLADWFGKDDMPDPSLITTFEVCAECARMEWISTDFHYIGEQSQWPCSTAKLWVEKKK